jgi:uncharacterized protein (DUF1800 family)
VSTIVESMNAVPIVVERAMWWPGPTPASWREAHNSAGATVTARRWALAEGEQDGPYNSETYVLIANTTTRTGSVRVTLFFEDGGLASRTVSVSAASRYTVAVGRDFPEAEGRRFASLVESFGPDPIDLVVERAMYSDAGPEHWAAGTDALGAPLAGDAIDLTSLGSSSVSVIASRPQAAEAGRTPGEFTFTRTGDAPITVVYRLAGTAGADDYDPLPRTVEFASGQRSAAVALVPVNDALVEGPETVSVTLLGSAQYSAASATQATIVLADDEPPIVPSTLVDAGRFLTQATFGPTTAEIARVQSMGYAAWLDEQMRLPVSSFVGYLQNVAEEYVDEPHVQEAWVQYATSAPDQLRHRVANALLEIMVVSNHNGLEGASWAHAAYMDVLLRHAFGNVRTLLGDVTLNPAMGRFLDMLKNDKEDPTTGRKPNENYARELLQLFTIGEVLLEADGTPRLDADGRPIPAYGQAEVDGFSKVFTGWTFHQTTQPYRFRGASADWLNPMVAVASRHSPGTKTLLNGVVLPAGQTPERDLDDALDNVFAHPNVGPFLARQLIQRLVTSNPSRGYVGRVAAAFNDNGAGARGDLAAVVRAILLDPEARMLQTSREATYGKVREPMIRFITVARAFNARARSGKYRIWDLDLDVGQGPFRAPSVFNFFSPDYRHPGELSDLGLVAPEMEITNEDTVIVAANTLRRLAYDAYGCSDEDKLRFDLTVEQGLASRPADLVAHLNGLLFAGGMSPGLQAVARQLVERIPAREPGWRVRAAIHLLVNSPEFVVQK